ncbi:MAG TPA: tyrosine--tRNA ligase [Vicinamibacterales bacterium]|jgi:tyrosyl-tRNA synthetase
MQQLFDELDWRGLVYDKTEGVREALAKEQVTGYIGFDPTASSLHVGNLLVMIALAHMQRCGHCPIAVVGGGTGMIGDPSGKTVERQLLTMEQVEKNVEGIRGQLARFLDFDNTHAPARLVNNAEWLAKLGAIDFMRDVGKHFTVNAMLAKDSVKRRIESDEGITYTEFSYSLLQAYDFLMLFDRFNCTLQMGGSDQWGNITAGMELIRRVRGGKAHGLVMPLITTASGTKFGKTEAGAVWLDPNLTSPFRFYQFWLNTEDGDVGRYLRYFTFLDRPTIAQLEEATRKSPELREAQRALAREVTRVVHGEAHVARAERASSVLFGEDISTLPADDVLAVFDDVPSSEVARQVEGWRLAALLVESQLAKSMADATRLIAGGGIYVNNRRVTDQRARLELSDAIDGRLFVLRKGAKQNHVVKIGSK